MMKYPILKFHLESWIALTVIILVESERPQFRDDYRYEKGFDAFYKLHHTAAPWRQARMRCEAEGAALLTPANLDEADAMPLLIATILNNHEGVFIGIHDFYAERLFVSTDGYPMLISILNLLWEHKEPRHGGGRCLAMQHNGRLLVRPCEKPLPFICKVKAAQIEFYEGCNTFDPRWKLGPNATCYFVHTEPQNWFDAFATCLAAGGHLAIINSRSEAQYVRSMLNAVPKTRLPDNHFAFLGFNDLFQRYHYRTIQGQRLEDSGYADWKLTCGKEANRSCADRCGGLRRSGLLAVADCDVPAMFICEKAVDTVAEQPESEEKPKKKTKSKKAKRDQQMGDEDGTEFETTTKSFAPSTSSKTTKFISKNASASIKSLTITETEPLSENTNTFSSVGTTRTTVRNGSLVTPTTWLTKQND